MSKELTLEEANAKITELTKVALTAETKVKDAKDKLYDAKDEWGTAKDALNDYRTMVLNALLQNANKKLEEKSEEKREESPRIEEIKPGKKGKHTS